MGCSRTAQQWRHIWSVWVAKVKTKARKVRDSLNATGGGPAEAPLNEIESKILEIVGSASVFGFSDIEIGIPSTTTPPPPPPPQTPNELPSVDSPTEPARPSPPMSSAGRRGALRRRRTARRPHPASTADLVLSLNTNSRLLRESIVQAAEILAAAIQSLGTTALYQEILPPPPPPSAD